MKWVLYILSALLAAGPWAAPAAGADDATASGEDLSEAELRKLMLRRQEVPSTEPDRELERETEMELPAAGSMVVARKCRLRPDPTTGWVVLEFLPEEGRRRETSRWALPSRRLEKMEAVAAAEPESVFRISGRTTIYQGRPFLLITTSPLLVSSGAADAEPEASEDAPEAEPVEAGPAEVVPERTPETDEAEVAAEDVAPDGAEDAEDAESATTRPAEETAASGEDVGPSADEMFEALMRDRPGRPIDPGGYTPVEAVELPSVAPGGGRELVTVAPSVIVNRLVRIPPAGPAGWQEVRFRSDNTLRRPPMRLLPCGQLEEAEKLGGPLRVSGVVTVYKGRKYLLLRKVIRQRDMDRL